MNNLEIAQSIPLRPIDEVALSAGLKQSDLEPLGRVKAKLTFEGIRRLREAPRGKLILVSAISPTPAGEGKTTTTIGLAQGLNRIGKQAIPAIREPALGPIFGIKGGACGGGYSQVLPMEEINLFFNGDFPAIAAAHNLLSAMLDASLFHGNPLGIDPRMSLWPRAVDMNDRALRNLVVGLGGKSSGVPREDGFVIVPASEIMAILCLSRSIAELKERLGKILVGLTADNRPVFARDLGAVGAMTALLKDAIRPNLAQTIEGGLAFVHGGPFGNIAHGCSSAIATECALGLADFVVTEAGFGSDLGAEKFLNLVCPQFGWAPNAIVLVATIRALQRHGNGDLAAGTANLARHRRHLGSYGPPVVIALNRRADDPPSALAEFAKAFPEAIECDPYGSGGKGCEALASAVSQAASAQPTFKPLYQKEQEFDEKLNAIIHGAYGGQGFTLSKKARARLDWLKTHELDRLPICVAKTQYSLSGDPEALNAPEAFSLEIESIRPSLGAGFLVPVAGDIMLMPGLGPKPNALAIEVDDEGRLTGLF